jgi:hypothetical protein
MNTTLPTTTPADKLADGAWPGQNDRVPVPQTSLLPGTEGAPAPAVELLHRAAQGAHHTIDRMVDGAAPTVQQLSDPKSGSYPAAGSSGGGVGGPMTGAIRSLM